MAAKPMSNQTKGMEPTSHSSWKTAHPWARSSRSLAYPSVLDMADAQGPVHVIVRDSREGLPQRCGTSSPRQTHTVFALDGAKALKAASGRPSRERAFRHSGE